MAALAGLVERPRDVDGEPVPNAPRSDAPVAPPDQLMVGKVDEFLEPDEEHVDPQVDAAQEVPVGEEPYQIMS